MDIDLPITVGIGRKNYALNLNIYRNTHYQTLNRMKVEFGSIVKDQVSTLPHYKSIDLTYTLYPKTKRLCDVANVCCIVDKFFCDVLVNNQIIPDDNYQVVKEVHYKFGEVDKENPRVTVTIKGDTNEDYVSPTRN